MNTDFNLYYPQLFFGLGMIAQIFFTIRGKFEKKDLLPLLGAIFLSLFFGFLFSIRSRGDFNGTIFCIYFSFAIISIKIFKEKILPEINEIVLLVWNVGFLSLYLSMIKSWNYYSYILLIPVCLSLVVGILKVNLNKLTKILLYLWFMIIAVFISVMSVPWNEISNHSSSHLISATQAFLLGIVFFYSFSYLHYIFYFIPIPGKHQSFHDRMVSFKEYTNLIISKFNNAQYHPILMLALFIMLGALMYVNYLLQFIEQNTLLSIILGLSIFVGEKFNNNPVKNF